MTVWKNGVIEWNIRFFRLCIFFSSLFWEWKKRTNDPVATFKANMCVYCKLVHPKLFACNAVAIRYMTHCDTKITDRIVCWKYFGWMLRTSSYSVCLVDLIRCLMRRISHWMLRFIVAIFQWANANPNRCYELFVKLKMAFLSIFGHFVPVSCSLILVYNRNTHSHRTN